MKLEELLQVFAENNGKSFESLDNEECSRLLSIQAKPYKSFELNGKTFPAGVTYYLKSELKTIKVRCTEKDYYNFVALVNSNVSNKEYGKFLSLFVQTGTNKDTNEKFAVANFGCVYNPIEEQAE